MEPLDKTTKGLISGLIENGYRRTKVPIPGARLCYFKIFRDETEERIYQIIYLFSDSGYLNPWATSFDKKYLTVKQECHLIGDHNIFLSNNRPLTIYGFEQMSLEFYHSIGKYMK